MNAKGIFRRILYVAFIIAILSSQALPAQAQSANPVGSTQELTVQQTDLALGEYPPPSSPDSILNAGKQAGATTNSATSSTRKWINGQIAYHEDLACIINTPENLTGEYVGYYGTDDASYPKVGDIYYGHVFVSVIGLSCAAGADITISILLPAFTNFVSDAAGNVPIKCYYTPRNSTTPIDVTNDPDANCVQRPTTDGDWWSLGTRIVNNGSSFEMIFPMYSTRKLDGIVGIGTQLVADVYETVAFNDHTAPYQWVTVAQNPPTIGYPAPSWKALNTTDIRLTGYTYAHFTPGNVYIDFGETTAYEDPPFAGGRIDGNGDWYITTLDLTGFTYGHTYHWRLRFMPDTGGQVVGVDQSFTYTGAYGGQTYVLSASASPAEGGTVTGAGSYAANANASVSATPKSGYRFNEWTLDGAPAGTTNPMVVNMNTDHFAVANFAPVAASAYTLTVSTSPTAGGDINLDPHGPYPDGSVITATATAKAGYQFANWTLDGANAGSANPLIVTMHANRSLVANFTLIPVTYYTLSTNASPTAGGNINVTPQGPYTAGSTATATAAANAGYVFSSWTLDGVNAGSTNPLNVTMNGNHSLTANFTPITYYTLSLSASPVAGGNVNATPQGPYAAGSAVTATATPITGYVFTNWTLDGANAGSVNPIQVTMNANHNLTANFTPVVPNTYSLSLSASPVAGGNINVTPQGPYQAGATASATATAKAGYVFSNWTLDGANAGTANPIQVTMNTNHSLTANFTPVVANYTLTLISLPNGSGALQASKPGPYPAGTDVTVTALPNSGYSFLDISIDGGTPVTTNPIHVTMDANHTITARFNLLPGQTLSFKIFLPSIVK